MPMLWSWFFGGRQTNQLRRAAVEMHRKCMWGRAEKKKILSWQLQRAATRTRRKKFPSSSSVLTPYPIHWFRALRKCFVPEITDWDRFKQLAAKVTVGLCEKFPFLVSLRGTILPFTAGAPQEKNKAIQARVCWFCRLSSCLPVTVIWQWEKACYSLAGSIPAFFPDTNNGPGFDSSLWRPGK